jgi:hypothetical protein
MPMPAASDRYVVRAAVVVLLGAFATLPSTAQDSVLDVTLEVVEGTGPIEGIVMPLEPLDDPEPRGSRARVEPAFEDAADPEPARPPEVALPPERR